jgi:hypothetical protein
MIRRTLGFVVNRLAQETSCTLARASAASYDVNGVLVPGTAPTAYIRALVTRPASGDDLLHLAEGDRIKRTCAVWSTAELRYRDILTFADGERYELQAIAPWTSHGGFYYAVGTKMQQ